LDELEKAYREGQNVLAFIPFAEELRRRRHYPRALQICGEGLARGGDSVRARTLMGLIHYDLGQYPEAVSSLREAVREAPGSYEPTLMLAKALTRERDFVEASRVLAPLRTSHASNADVQFLDRVIRAEISQSITGLTEPIDELGERPREPLLQQLRRELEDMPGVDAVFEFGLVEEGGDIFFEDVDGQELDDDIKITLIECARLASKLDYGSPRQALLETPTTRLFFLFRHTIGLMAVAGPRVKLGKLRFLMDQYLLARSAKSRG